MDEARPAFLADGSAIHSGPEILSGTPVSWETRVPVSSLFEYLQGGCSVDEFLESFPTVCREQIDAVLRGRAGSQEPA
jgi:uncharacterized protein (DUF433 family)